MIVDGKDLMNDTVLKHPKHGRDARTTEGKKGARKTCVSAKRTGLVS